MVLDSVDVSVRVTWVTSCREARMAAPVAVKMTFAQTKFIRKKTGENNSIAADKSMRLKIIVVCFTDFKKVHRVLDIQGDVKITSQLLSKITQKSTTVELLISNTL